MGNSISDSIDLEGCDMCRKSDKSKMVAIGANTAGTMLPLHSGIGAVFTVSNDNQIIYCASAEGSSSHDAIERGLLNRGDVLVSIDGVPMKGRSMQDVAARLLGVRESIVMVKFRRQTDKGFVENTIAMDRRPMQLDAIKKVAQSLTHV